MTKNQIISEIKYIVDFTSYSIWTIGITDDPERRQSEYSSAGRYVTHWKHWKTDSENIGREVEKYFLSLGMKGDTGGGGMAGYVYIF